MRIGMMADAYKPHVSGITNYISLNKRCLEEAGHEVFVFTFKEHGYVDAEPNIIRSPGLPLTDTGYSLSLSYPRPVRALLKTMDLVHVHHPFISGTLALRYCRPQGIPILFTNHTRYDLYAQAYIPGMPGFVSDSVIQAYLPAFCRGCDLVIAPSEGLHKVLERFGVDAPIQVIPNGVELEAFAHLTHKEDRSDLGYEPDHCVLIYTGRLGPEKNLPFLLRAFAGVSQAVDQARLLIVGDGPERENLENRVEAMKIQDKVTFTGMIPYTEIGEYLTAADAFVTASVTEVHPLSVIEAMGAGLPVLGIDSPGVGDIVEDGKTGYLSSDDLAAFTAKMVRLVSDTEKRKEMGRQAREASQMYDIRRTSQLMEECYQTLIQTKVRRRFPLRSWLLTLMDLFRS